ncbi:protein PIEZO2-like protein [Camelus ferus]|nr:protein PIEZO2-like protein [Camelus ferus]
MMAILPPWDRLVVALRTLLPVGDVPVPRDVTRLQLLARPWSQHVLHSQGVSWNMPEGRKPRTEDNMPTRSLRHRHVTGTQDGSHSFFETNSEEEEPEGGSQAERTDDRPKSKAAFQATVIVKYFSQLGFFPWTTKRYAGVNREKPFSLPNVTGVEKQKGTVLRDLLPLLALLSHRSTLKDLPDLLLHLPLLLPLHPAPTSPACDVSALTFLVEALSFAAVLFGSWAFGGSQRAPGPRHSPGCRAQHCGFLGASARESGFMELQFPSGVGEGTPPDALLAVALAQLGATTVDWALCLRKTLLGKVVFQLSLVLGTHFWLFFVLSGVTNRQLSTEAPLLLLGGDAEAQVWHGYSRRILGNVLTKNFNLINLILFKGCVENHLQKYSQPPRHQKAAVKYRAGGITMFALLFLMWLPLVFRSLLKTVGGVTNWCLDVSVKIAIDGYKSAAQFLPEDIVLAKIKSHASLLWASAPPTEQQWSTHSVYIAISWTIQT